MEKVHIESRVSFIITKNSLQARVDTLVYQHRGYAHGRTAIMQLLE